MKKIGIWIDTEKAHIVTLKNEHEYFETVVSELEFFNPVGGSRSKTRWGPQDVVQDNKYSERKKQQLKNYFQAIAEKVADAEQLALFGPAGSNEKLRKELELSYPRLAAKIKTVTKVDSMTDNQVKALVRDFYASKN